MRFRKIDENDDFRRLAELIYQTDPYLYPDLFGSEETAKKVLPILLKTPGNVFYRDYYYAVEENGEIAGIAQLFLYDVKWEKTAVRNAFFQANCQVPDTFQAVNGYFETTYNSTRTGFNACNICVAKSYRGRGVGTFLLEHFIRIVNADIELSVLADNEAAVRLYQKSGFRVLYDYLDYGGADGGKVKCYKMYRAYERPGA